jgi:hypothetical protein
MSRRDNDDLIFGIQLRKVCNYAGKKCKDGKDCDYFHPEFVRG